MAYADYGLLTTPCYIDGRCDQSVIHHTDVVSHPQLAINQLGCWDCGYRIRPTLSV